MRYLIIIISLLLFTTSAHAQNVISINASAEELVPADRISFNINLNAEAETPQKAYDLHKKREQVLVKLLKKHNVAEGNIDFEPISITKTNDRRYPQKEESKIVTNQSVVLSLDDFDVYEEIQIALIDNDFDQFSGNFISSKSGEGEDAALRKALNLARQKADIIAGETGLTIGGIKDISYSYNHQPPRPMEMAAFKASDSLMEFEQTVSVSASVSVTYNFKK